MTPIVSKKSVRDWELNKYFYMKSKGNSEPQNCMLNLLRLNRGEVRLDIQRGLDPEMIDMPETFVTARLQAEAYWLLNHYEPRINFTGLQREEMNEPGEFELTTKATLRENV